MHDNKVTKSQLADELGVSREYVSMVLNGHRTPADAETRFAEAFSRIIRRRNEHQPG
jgi:transcriptional regulator with XRE-family HTH domain